MQNFVKIGKELWT